MIGHQRVNGLVFTGLYDINSIGQAIKTWWPCGRVLDLRSMVHGFESHERHCNVSLSKTFHPLLSTGSKEEMSLHD